MAEAERHSEVLLDHCPVCLYSLEGLPMEHRCPECGFEFDRRCWLFGSFPGRRWWSGIGWVWIGALICGCVAAYLPYVWYGAYAPLLIMFATSLASVPLIRLYLGYWAAIGPSGLRLFDRDRLLREVSWDEFVVADIGENGLRLLDGHGKVVKFGEQAFLLWAGERKRFAKMANTYRQALMRRRT